LTPWWRSFNDAQLTALVTQALQANTDVLSAQAALRQAQALHQVKLAALQPSLNVSAAAQRSKSGSAATSNSFSTGLDAAWEPDVYGGNHSAAAATAADAQAAGASLSQVQVTLAATVAQGYIELRGLQARLSIARHNLDTQTETLQITRWRAQAGLVSELDVAQATTAAEQTQAQIPALETSLAQAEHSLAVLTGQAPSALHGTLAPPAPLPQVPGDMTTAPNLHVPAQLLRQRADVRAAEYRISAALARVAVADAALLPSFSISGSLGLRALTLSGLTGGGSAANALLASVSLPLWDGGAARAQVQAQTAALDAARISYQAATLAALKDVEDALVTLHGLHTQLARLQAAADAAAMAEQLARQRYSSGLIDFATVLSTQRTLLSTQDSVASSQASLSAAQVRLYQALGGGWQPDAVHPS
jgi:NodT family efflux transporter outer membrane factor (OMF) lipoprotein